MTEPTFDSPGYVYIARAIVEIASTKEIEIDAATNELRTQLAGNQSAAFIVDPYKGDLLRLPANAWNIDQCLEWLKSGKAEMTAAEGQRSRIMLDTPPLCWIYIKQIAVTTALPDKPAEPKPARKEDTERRYAAWVKSEIADGRTNDDRDTHVKKAMHYLGIDRDRARELRDKFFPPQLRKKGPKPRA